MRDCIFLARGCLFRKVGRNFQTRVRVVSKEPPPRHPHLFFFRLSTRRFCCSALLTSSRVMDALPPTHQFQAQNQIQDSSAEHRVPQYGPFHDQSQGLSAASQPAQIPLPDPKKSPPSNDSPAVKASPAPTTGTPQGKERTRHSSACAPCVCYNSQPIHLVLRT